ncbi:MAG: hypothetical protein COU22_01235 [Candidatus Komeilibacteria bacterium CG10_big_fil_rev_8_21_14_0_10_41_13]|uniref:Methicillin resistance protein n=1 Tax=Candidatus Komeilibacteria bacterium CG10_big_fil_rev_8_21_14_0_10_41_13 TaxID=1974476 RepID=A0A2M6WCY3_9BACT|nr:MAG: hypothetical protein COU22_01235 [Candidatus Komeilibacteria bacterium CG10_big_fil_rev_8_21_14_0_10_41_13]
MELVILQPNELDNFVSGQEVSQFLQSSSWANFQENVGHKVWRFGIKENERLIATAVIIEHLLPLQKSYLYCPRGPIIDSDLTEAKQAKVLGLIFSKARDLTIETKQAEEIFFRFEPLSEIKLKEVRLHKTKDIQPSTTSILKLAKTSEELLQDMQAKTRYNIRLAEKHEVKVAKLTSHDWPKAWPLFKQTSRRDNFNLHPQNYYQTMLEKLVEVELWVALNQDGDIIVANLISFFGNVATYLHGASDYNHRQLMAPYLLQWQIIQEAKNRGCKYYDFHGLAPKNQPNHPLVGVSRFKQGFKGKTVSYPGAFDLVYSKGWYKLYKLSRQLNKLLRR